MFIDPLAPRMEVVRTALIGDTLERSDPNTVVKWNGNGSLFTGLGMGIFQDRVVAACSVMPVTEFL